MLWSVVTMVCSSYVHPSVAFHIFHIFSRNLSQIELKLGVVEALGLHEIQDC